LENLDSAVSHSWYVQPNGGPNFVYSSKSFLEDSINKTVELYNMYLGENTSFDTVILATGNCGINYLSRGCQGTCPAGAVSYYRGHIQGTKRHY